MTWKGPFLRAWAILRCSGALPTAQTPSTCTSSAAVVPTEPWTSPTTSSMASSLASWSTKQQTSRIPACAQQTSLWHRAIRSTVPPRRHLRVSRSRQTYWNPSSRPTTRVCCPSSRSRCHLRSTCPPPTCTFQKCPASQTLQPPPPAPALSTAPTVATAAAPAVPAPAGAAAASPGWVLGRLQAW